MEDLSAALGPLEAAIRTRIAGESGDFGIAVVDVETGRRIGVNDGLVVHAASTMKVPVLIELYRRAAEGTIDLDGRMTVRTTFRSIADTSHYALSAEDDSEAELYGMSGERVTLRELARRMIVRSSNLATNLLIDTLGAPAIMATMERIDATGMTVRRGVEDGPAFRAGLNNTANARGLANALTAIARCDLLPPRQCTEAQEVLAQQEFNDMIPAGLPAGTRVAHKTGWITGIAHDGAIVYPNGGPPFVLVVLTRDASSREAANRVAADVATLTWQALGPNGTLRPRWSADVAGLFDTYDRFRVGEAFPEYRVAHDELWRALGPIVERAPGISVEEVGRSGQGRPIRLVRFGDGPTRVLLWSQMHGDEPTATRALVDLLHYIASAPDDARVRMWRERLTVLAIPMLNPDGAELPQRRNAFGVDVNRDARRLATPEGRTLKAMQEKWRPAYGFNLHDQNPRTRVGRSDRLAAIALLAPPPDARATHTESYDNALHLVSHIGQAIEPLVQGHLTRYDDTFNPRAFGDLMESWGVGTVLIESGAWHGDPAKHYLRKVNFVALATALDAIASGRHLGSDVGFYQSLPENGRAIDDLLVVGGMLVLPGAPPTQIDLAIDQEGVGGVSQTQIVDIGDLGEVVARDTIDAAGLFIHLDDAAARMIRPGMAPEFTLRRGADRTSEPVWVVRGIDARRLVNR